MAKSRKDQFEEQLKDLQKDISKLSQKLSTPPLSESKPQSDLHNLSSASIVSDTRSHRSLGSISHLDVHDTAKTLEKLRIELHHSNKERDDAIYKLEQAKLEIDHLKKGIQETARLRAALDHLKQDHDSLRISLESSERIRKQQKDLINLLQRSHAISAATGGMVHPVDVSPSKAENSLISHLSYASNHHDQSLASHHSVASHHSQRSDSQQHYAEAVGSQPSQSGSVKLKRRIKTSGSSVSSASHRATASGSVASTVSGSRPGSKSKPSTSTSGRRVSGSGASTGSRRSNHSKSSGGAKGGAVDLSYSTRGEAPSYADSLQYNRSLIPPSAALQGSVLSYNPPPSQQQQQQHHHYGGGGGNSTILTTDNMSFISALGNGSTSRVLFDSSAPSSRATSRSNSFDVPHSSSGVPSSSSATRNAPATAPGASVFTFSDSSIEGASHPSSYPHYPPPQPHPLPHYSSSSSVQQQSPYRFEQAAHTSAPTPPRPPFAVPSAVSSTGKPPRHPSAGTSSVKKAAPPPLHISTAADRHQPQYPVHQQMHHSHSAPASPRHSPRKASATPTKSSLKKVLIRSPRSSLPTYEQYQSLTSHSSGLLSPSRKVKRIRAFSAPHSSVLVGGGHTASSAGRLGGRGAGGGPENGGGSPGRLFNVPIPSPATSFGHADRKLQ